MTRKVYRTAQGKMVDLGRLQLQNENTRAVGNMKVNARGDLIDSLNRPISTRKQQVNRAYTRQTSNVNNDPVSSGRRTVKPQIPPTPEDFDDDFDKGMATPPAASPAAVAAASPEPAPQGGLAAAIARARQVKQEPLKPLVPGGGRQPGVKKL